MTPTTQQQAFLDALLNTSSHLALIARAGCGKTSTIMMAVKALVDWAASQGVRLEMLVCAYNKAIAQEISEKLKRAGYDWKTVQASTLHALGFGLLKYAFNPEVNGYKVRDYIRSIADNAADPEQAQFHSTFGSHIASLVGYAKQAAVGFFGQIENMALWYELAEHYGLEGLDDPRDADRIVQAAQSVYRWSLDNTQVIDFDDMILMPLIRNMQVRFGKDVIFLDEAQDLSPARQALARKFLKPRTGRMVIVGDDRQAIYGFSGADAQALENMVASYSATVLPLSVTWRCPKAVVAVAQTIVPDIEAAPEAPEGLVQYLTTEDELEALLSGLEAGRDAILCRNTAPLITLAYQLIRAGTPAKVEGRQIGEGLAALAKRWKVRQCSELLNRLEAYESREVGKLQAKGRDDRIEEVTDKVECLREIIKGCQSKGLQQVTDVLAAIDSLFGDDVKGAVTLATYHRSKGREWPRVILWEHSARCPSRGARQPWQQLQERNLAYVAFTRAQETLVFAY